MVKVDYEFKIWISLLDVAFGSDMWHLARGLRRLSVSMLASFFLRSSKTKILEV